MSRPTDPPQSDSTPPTYGDQQERINQVYQQQPQIRRLTPDEMRAFRECNRESFYYRSLPLSALGVAAVRYLCVIGYFKPSPMFGNYLKYAGAVMAGYLVGKFSYLGKCREKLMALPNSELAEALKKSYAGGKRQFEVLQEMVSLPEINTGSDQGYSPAPEGSDMYTNPDYSVSGGAKGSEESQPAQRPTTNYDELRRRNREEYLKQQFGMGTPQSPGQQQSGQQQRNQPQTPQQPPGPSRDDAQFQRPPPQSKFSYGPPQPSSNAGSKYGDQDFK